MMLLLFFVHILTEHSKQFPGNEMLRAIEIAVFFISVYHDAYHFRTVFSIVFPFYSVTSGWSRWDYTIKMPLRTVNRPYGIFSQIHVPKRPVRPGSIEFAYF